MPDLWLSVKQIYFDQFKAGDKIFEYRLINDYWTKRLVGRDYERLIYRAGYPSKDQTDRIIELPYRGYELHRISHSHFGDEPVDVFAIPLTTKAVAHEFYYKNPAKFAEKLAGVHLYDWQKKVLERIQHGLHS